jgi:hypothetical protein
MRTPPSDLCHGTDFQEFDDEFHESMIESDAVGQLPDRKRHGGNRCARQKRRKVPKASHPGCGIGARRKRHWSS